ncbi:hypothetical protein [Streptomyces rishiriensis]|uniref:Uncharacterized protein n=1 Tax=Streptomyces rishiriensis TaxID=68264 RepID=A0ABU0NPH7_STRRH|nr:hypothetical protein [Streptomyces rishiriensis]MDQ0581046.1 hypothetical protein [Streptomyces rishiriensis]
MGLPKRRCPNCGDTDQHFRHMHDDEKAFALKQGLVHRADLDKFRRCTREGCVRVQSYFNWRSGFDLPEEFRSPPQPAVQ